MAYADRVSLLSYDGLQGHPGGKLALHEADDGRFWLYVGSYWHPGWSILEVTDPAQARYVRWLEAPPNTDAFQVQVADGKLVCGVCPMHPEWGGNPAGGGLEGLLVFDLSNPDDPQRIGHWESGARGTHRNFYAGGRYVHAATTLPGFQGEIYALIDIDDPERPQLCGKWWLPGQHVAAGESFADESGSSPVRSAVKSIGNGRFLHGGAYVIDNRAYCPWALAGMIILDITDGSQPRLISRLPFYPPLGSAISVHTVVPLPERNLAIVNSEALAEGGAEATLAEPLNYVGLVDISDERDPLLVSLFPVPECPPDYPHDDFFSRRARFGPHNQHQPQEQACLMPSDHLVYMTYFSAGLQIFDISNPRRVRIVGSYIPDDPEERVGPHPTELVTQCEDVLVDRRGVIYMTERNSGLYVMRHELS
jgi:hypothetical protein